MHPGLLPIDRFIQTLEIVYKEGRQLLWSRERLFIRAAFVTDLALARGYCTMLIDTYHGVRRDAIARLGLAEQRLSPPLEP